MKHIYTTITILLSTISLVGLPIIGNKVIFSTPLAILSYIRRAKAEKPGVYNQERATFYFNRAYKKEQKGDTYGAISDYTKAIEIDPKLANAYINRGLAKSNLKDYKGALKDFDKAIELKPTDFIFYKFRGRLNSRLEDYEGALYDFNKALDINPKGFELYKDRGDIKISLQNYKGAVSDYTKALKNDPTNSSLYLQRAVAYISEGKQEPISTNDAISDLTQAIEFISYNESMILMSIYELRASIRYAYLKDKKGACKDWKQVALLNSSDVPKHIEVPKNYKKYCMSNNQMK